MNDRPSSIELGPSVGGHPRGLYACEAGSSGQRCLAISSALTNALPGSSGASVSSTNVDLPAPLDPTTRSSRFIGWARRYLPRRDASAFGRQHDRAAVRAVLDDLTRPR